MSSVNKSIVIGYVGADPEVRTTKNDTKVANFSVATSESWQDNEGEWQEETTWHNVVAWAGRAEWAGKNIKKGSRVYVEGPTKEQSYENKEGETRKQRHIKALSLQLMDNKAGSGETEEE